MQFKDIVGQKAIAAHLRSTSRSSRVSHAQLFAGRMGYGGYALALAYAQYLLCDNPTEGDSCGVCPSCVQCAAMSHPDIHFVMPVNKQGKKSGESLLSSDFLPLWRSEIINSGGYLTPAAWSAALDLGKTLKGVITVKEADSILSRLSLKSYSGGYKVMIIWLPEAMNEQTANKILKILEEPYPQTLFLLVSEQPQLLLATILSRVLSIEIPPIDADSSIEWLLSGKYGDNGALDKRSAHAIARLAGGDLNELREVALGSLDEQRALYFELFSLVMRLSYNDKHLELLEWGDRVAGLSREGQVGLLRYSAALLREAYIIHAGAASISYLWGDEEAFCHKFAPFIGNQNIESLISEIELALAQLSHNTNPSILFTHMALKISKQINRL